MSESPLLLFTILSIIAAYLLLQAIKRKDTIKVFLYSGSIGIFSGLAGESKLNGLVCAVLAIVTSIIMLYKYRWELKNAKVKIFLISTLTIIFFTLLIFVIVYPFFYHDTIQRVIETFHYRMTMIDYQKNTFLGIILPGQRTEVLVNKIFSYPIHLPNQDETNPLVLLIVNMCVTAFGVFYGIRSIYKNRDNKEADKNLILIISAIMLSTPVLFTPFDWGRYFLYPVYFTCLFFSLGIGQLCLFFINNRFSRQRGFFWFQSKQSFTSSAIG